jgi:predicted NBD/HSP70 family sugar kinase
VLNHVREKEPISRAEIARETLLQRSTISVIVEALKNDGLIEVTGEGESTGGRPPTMLRLRAAGPIAIGVSITPARTTVATCDLAGRVIDHEEFPADTDSEMMFKTIIKAIRKYSRRSDGSIEGVGVSISGLVDPEAGHAIYVPYFNWRDLPVEEIISSATGLPVIIENDANAVALAELWFGRPEVTEARDFIVVLIGSGVGTGIVIDGTVYRGERGAAGEFGHMIVGAEAPIACSCGNYDCWEAFSSERAAVARYMGLNGDRTGKRSPEFSEIVNLALSGNEKAKKALIETAHYIGIGISNLVVGFSPKVVVVGGEISRAWSLVEDALNETISRSVRRGLPSAAILPSKLVGEPNLMGALSLVLSQKFSAAVTI